MTRSQHRRHTGKRSAAQRKARRAGYHWASLGKVEGPRISAAPPSIVRAIFTAPKRSHAPNLVSSFRHGADDWKRKHRADLEASA